MTPNCTCVSLVITDYETTMNKLDNVITDIRKWMYLNKLKLNSDKTEVLFIGTRQQLEKCRDFIRKDQKIGSESIKPVTSVRNLGFYMDERLDGESHIKKIYDWLCFIKTIIILEMFG